MSSCSRIENFLLWSTKIVIYVIPILPLYISFSVMFPFITGKNFAFRILVELAAALWLGLMATNKMYRLQNSIMVTAVLIFTFVVGLADLFGVDPYNSFWSNYERMEGYITVLHLALYFIIIKSIFRITKDWTIFFSIFLTVSALAGLFTFIEPNAIRTASNYIMEYGTRRAGTIGNPPFLASYLLFSVFLGFILICNIQKLYLKLFCVVSIMLNSIVIYLTASRGAILAAVAGAFIIGVYFIFSRIRMSCKEGFRKILPLVVGLFIISSFIFWVYSNFSFVRDNKTISRLMMISLNDRSVETRLYSWKIAWNGIKEKPILGWGQENFVGVYTMNPIPVGEKLVWLDRAHNIVLDWLVNAGYLGLLSYLAIYGSAFYIIRNNLRNNIISKNEALLITSGIIVYFVQNLFTFDTISTYLIFFALIAYIDNIESIRNVFSLNLKDNINSKTTLRSLTVTMSALLVIAFTSYYINYIPLQQLQLHSQISTSLAKYDSFSKMLDDFNKALSYRTFGDNYIREQMAGVSRQIVQYQLYEEEGALKVIQRTIEEMEKRISGENHNLEYILHVYGLYELLASYDPSFIPRAEALIERCLRINPEFTRIETDKVNLYFLKREYESAYVKLKEYTDRYPKLSGWQFKLALAAILTSRDDEAEKALENAKYLKIANSNDIASGIKPVFTIKQLNMLAQAHMEVKNYNHVLKYYHEIISNLSNYKDIRIARGYIQPLTDEDKINMKAKLHYEIAKIYITIGDKENAIKESNKAAELDPQTYSEKANDIKAIID